MSIQTPASDIYAGESAIISWRNIKKDAIIHFCKAKALERCGGVFMMELVKKHIHMNRRSGSVASQMTLDDDFNVPDTMEDVEQLILERGEIQCNLTEYLTKRTF